jgi:hypothetical protein
VKVNLISVEGREVTGDGTCIVSLIRASSIHLGPEQSPCGIALRTGDWTTYPGNTGAIQQNFQIPGMGKEAFKIFT